MNLRCVETFICVAECASFRRAAELLHRSQSAVSVHVRQLEEELGIPLFDRTTRRVALTAEGHTLLARTKVIVSELRSAADELRNASGVRGGVIDIGVTPSMGATVLPAVMVEFGNRYPMVTVRVHEAFARGLYEDLRQRKTDFALGPAVTGLKDFDYRILGRERLLAVLPPAYPLAGRKSIALKELLEKPFLSMPVGTYLRRIVENSTAARGLQFQPKLELGSFATLLAQVAAGVGASVVPASAITLEWQARLQVVPVRTPSLAWDRAILMLKGKRLSPIASRLREVVVEIAGREAVDA